uniref:RPGR interacting protein 1 n=1 Tax=Sinocyclocheilus rhinocerous TaxID=307959 RepID=A0A673JDM4_9TELE
MSFWPPKHPINNQKKKAYNFCMFKFTGFRHSTMSVQNHQEGQHEKKDKRSEESWREDVQRLEERLEEERKEKKMLEQEKEQMRQENDQVQKEKARDRGKTHALMQRETQGMMCFLKTDEKIEETSKDLTAVQASHAETVLELQKTRDLLLLQHRLNADLQVHTHLDPAGSPRGMVRATLRWKYPFQSSEAPSRQREEVEKERMYMFLVLDVKSQLYIIKSYICLCVSQGDRLRVEILSLSFNRSSSVALDQSVHQVYVEYRLLGITMETTETPMSLRKPTDGEEIHYNFTRVIHVDSMEAAPLRHYLYTMLEGSDPNQGRLKFTVVSEPMNEQEECEDVGYAYLDLQELLLTGNDFIEEQIDVVSADEEQDVVGKLKVSVEAAQALNGIYQEYHQISLRVMS